MKCKRVRLYGKLGAKFGREFYLYVNSPAEAIRALCCQIKGFQQYLCEGHEHGIAYVVLRGKHSLSKDQLHYPSGNEDIRIAPVIQGRKNAIGQVIIGAVIVVASIVSYQWYGVGYGVAFAAGSLGAAIALGGVMQMMTNQPKGLGVEKNEDQKKSYIFGGQPNTPAMGQAVPVAYGNPWCVPLIISSAIIAEDYRV